MTTPALPQWPSYGFAFQRITAFVRLAVLQHRLVIRLNANPHPMTAPSTANPSAFPPSSYPIGTPGQAWGPAEQAQWRARQVRQRSYADDVLVLGGAAGVSWGATQEVLQPELIQRVWDMQCDPVRSSDGALQYLFVAGSAIAA